MYIIGAFSLEQVMILYTVNKITMYYVPTILKQLSELCMLSAYRKMKTLPAAGAGEFSAFLSEELTDVYGEFLLKVDEPLRDVL